MACKMQSALVALLVVLFATSGQAIAGRDIPGSSKKADVKQPESFIKSDGSVLIPGIGRVLLPPRYNHLPFYYPYIGGGGSGGGNYLPGGDDTFVPNPGDEVPNPGRVGADPEQAHP